MAKQERVGARDQRPQPALLLAGCRHLLHQVDVAFVGRVDVQRRRTSGVTGFFEYDRLGDVPQAEAAELAASNAA